MADDKLHILVVEDSAILRAELRKTLRGYGAQVTDAENGSSGWQILSELKRNKKSPPDIIISDIVMPHMSGLQLLEKVRNDAEIKSLPFIILTSNKEDLLKMAALCLDVTAFYIKPPDPAHLLTQLKKMFPLKKLQN